MKKEKIIIESVDGSIVFDLVPGKSGDAKQAYIRILGGMGEYYGSIDNGNIRRLKKIHRWLSEIVEANI